MCTCNDIVWWHIYLCGPGLSVYCEFFNKTPASLRDELIRMGGQINDLESANNRYESSLNSNDEQKLLCYTSIYMWSYSPPSPLSFPTRDLPTGIAVVDISQGYCLNVAFICHLTYFPLHLFPYIHFLLGSDVNNLNSRDSYTFLFTVAIAYFRCFPLPKDHSST